MMTEDSFDLLTDLALMEGSFIRQHLRLDNGLSVSVQQSKYHYGRVETNDYEVWWPGDDEPSAFVPKKVVIACLNALAATPIEQINQ